MTRPPRVVALGGGHGLAASLAALRHLTRDLTAVVTVADNGGSSGRLRQQFASLPPGDLRMALAALSKRDHWGATWRDVLQHRFGGDAELSGHAVGNLLIVALWEICGDAVQGLDLVGRLVEAEGRVLPMSTVPLEVGAEITRIVDGAEWRTTIRGQAKVAAAQGRVDRIWLNPSGARACPEAVQAIRQADWVVLGPGSWYTSVIPHLLIPDLAEAVTSDHIKRCVTLNLTNQGGETSGYTAADHIAALLDYAGNARLDVVIADPASVDNEAALRAQTAKAGAQLLIRPVRRHDSKARHDSLLLAAAYREAFSGTNQTELE